jgi:hypothetical protein
LTLINIFAIINTWTAELQSIFYKKEHKMSKEDKLIEVGINEGNNIFFKILDDYPELNNEDPRQSALLLSLMTNCIVRLHIMGWSEKDLVKEVFDHCEIARDILDDIE